MLSLVYPQNKKFITLGCWIIETIKSIQLWKSLNIFLQILYK